MPNELFSVRMGITKKKKCMFGKDEELAPDTRYLDDITWATASTDSGTASEWPNGQYAVWVGDD